MAELSEAAAQAIAKEDGDAVRDKVRAAARAGREEGLYTIPIPRGQKAPDNLAGWPDERITLDQVDQRFDKSCNIGGLWGVTGLVDIDLDRGEAVKAAPFFFEDTLTYGHKNRRKSHLIVRCASVATHKYRPWLEVRSTGAQSVLPPSLHPGGDLYEFGEPRQPVREMTKDELQKAASRTASVAEAVQHWDKGDKTRHDKALALSGALARSGWSDDDVLQFIRVTVHVAGDEEVDNREQACLDTLNNYRKGPKKVTGWRKVAELFGQRDCRQVVPMAAGNCHRRSANAPQNAIYVPN
jgi:putative DNA primase/helicase